MNKDTEVLVGEDINIKILNNLQASGFDLKDVMEKDVEKNEKLEECQDSTDTSKNDDKTTSKDESESQWIQLYILIVILAYETNTKVRSPIKMSLLEAQADFGLNLLRATPYAASQSTIISPISISIALAMCYVGAKNQTANQISQAIAGDAPSDKILDYFSTIMTQLNLQDKSYVLDSANRIYVQENFQLLQSYKQILTNKFQGQFENINFSNSEAAAQNINSFIEQATRGKIKDLISSNAINDLTRMILTSAIYFKGTWEYKFETNQTAPKTFYLSENREQQVPMMKIKNTFPYYEDNQVQVLGLPYKSQEVFLYVFLPKDRFGLRNLLQDITGQQLQNHIQEAHKWHNDRLRHIRIDVELPCFKIETELSLNDALKKLGITDAFDEKRADFSGMTGSHGLYVSDVVHNSFIETNEEGSEAVAATGVFVTFMSSNGGSFELFQTFHADHPFLYALATRQGDILFTGTVASLERKCGKTVSSHHTLKSRHNLRNDQIEICY